MTPADRADVIVCGGGLAGVSAALASARAGAETVLIERESYVGGIPARGICSSIFNCYATAGGEQAITGLPVEIADALAADAGYGRRWREHAGPIVFDTEGARRVLAEMLQEAGARTLLDATVVGALTDGNVIRGVEIECASGHEEREARVVVDCTGTAEVAAVAGAKLRTSERAPGRAFSIRIGNVDLDALAGFYEVHPDEYPAYMDVNWSAAEALAAWRATGAFVLPHGGPRFTKIVSDAAEDGGFAHGFGLHGSPGTAQTHGLRSTGVLQVVTGLLGADPSDQDDISREIDEARSLAQAVVERLREEMPGFGRAYICGTAERLGAPPARWSEGAVEFTREMRAEGARFDDAVGRGACYHQETKSDAPDAWRAQVMGDQTFDLPWRSLLPIGVEGLLMGSGRTVSGDSPTVLWVMALTMMVGQAAGAGAAVASRSNQPPRAVAAHEVQEKLARQGVELN
ncbi:MAG: FAD-dependent oxidoreductase [Armatimonadota bacterium]